jgi:hypothetical protein
VPVQSDFFYHFIPVASGDIDSAQHIDQNNQQEYDSRKNVETVEACDKKEKRTKSFRTK